MDPRGVERIVIRNQNIMAWYIPREELSWVKENIPETSRPGIYFLVNDTLGRDGHVPVYVGLAREGINRVLEHDSVTDMTKRKMFSHIVLITGIEDGAFDDASISYLERVFIDDVFEAEALGYRVDPLNKVQPKDAYTRNEDQHVYDEYAAVIKWYIEYRGYNYCSDTLYAGRMTELEPMLTQYDNDVQDLSNVSVYLRRPDVVESIAPTTQEFMDRHSPVYRLKRRGVRNVYGIYNSTTGYFHVFSGSEIKEKCMACANRHVKTSRQTLLDEGYMSYVGDRHIVFDVDVAFNSPGEAASFVVGGSANDSAWVVVSGQTYEDIVGQAEKSERWINNE